MIYHSNMTIFSNTNKKSKYIIDVIAFNVCRHGLNAYEQKAFSTHNSKVLKIEAIPLHTFC